MVSLFCVEEQVRSPCLPDHRPQLCPSICRPLALVPIYWVTLRKSFLGLGFLAGGYGIRFGLWFRYHSQLAWDWVPSGAEGWWVAGDFYDTPFSRASRLRGACTPRIQAGPT